MSVEVTTTSWFSRIGSSIKGILIGFLLIIGATILLFWNEGRAVKTHNSLLEGAGQVVSVSAKTIDQVNDGKLIHVTGLATTNQIISEDQFHISETALKLKRTTHIYQWIESQSTKEDKNLGGSVETTTTYSYKKDWANGLIDSSSFHDQVGHSNPTAVLYDDLELLSKDVTLDVFKLTPGLLSKISNYSTYPLKEENVKSIKNASVINGVAYTGSTRYPLIGDLKIEYSIIKPTEVSIVAVQTNDTFKPFVAKAGRSIELLSTGNVSPEAMFTNAIEGNKVNTWILRLVGIFLMFLGFRAILRPLSVVADVVPFVGSIIGFGTALISMILAGIVSLVTIGIAWVFYRPLLGIILLGIAAALTFWFIAIGKKEVDPEKKKDISKETKQTVSKK